MEQRPLRRPVGAFDHLIAGEAAQVPTDRQRSCPRARCRRSRSPLPAPPRCGRDGSCRSRRARPAPARAPASPASDRSRPAPRDCRTRRRILARVGRRRQRQVESELISHPRLRPDRRRDRCRSRDSGRADGARSRRSPPRSARRSGCRPSRSADPPASRANMIHTGCSPTRSPTQLGRQHVAFQSTGRTGTRRRPWRPPHQSGGNCASAMPSAMTAPTNVPTKG